MFVHPRCPCSRASLAELREIMAQANGRLNAFVLFLRPQGTADVWEHTATWAAAQDIPGVAVRVDRDGAEAARFGAATSGHTVLYNAEGRLLFAGGITAARGHVGDNSGRQSVLALLDNKSAAPAHLVYGCRLRDRTAQRGGV
jgi:glyoxylase-like metal-dependent hydrolase (beta-lactamase superfamily II)